MILLATPSFPFGPNIHVVYQVNPGKLVFLHPDFDWIVSEADQENLSNALIALISPEDLLILSDAYSRAIHGEFSGSIKVKLNTGSPERWLQVSPFLAGEQSNPFLLCSLCDITDETLNTEVIARYTNKKNSILHMLAHDLRGPLNVAKSVINVVDKEIAEKETGVTDLRKKTQYIEEVLQQAIDLISDLVTRELLETTEVVLVKKRIDIVYKLREYLEESIRSEDLAEKSFTLTSSVPEIFIEVDEAKFMQIVNNLISNALKFTGPQGKIRIEVTEVENQVSFSFSDDGIGIPKHQLGEIFEKFTTARRPGLNGEPTLGLGLSIVKTIVGWHDGKIWCESKEGLGSTFRFVLPKG
ncbi:sensor histidine kinase [Pedobacter metabolipauper]|uniref:histidine kinase n=1 Tax=Pedobacter metabolipauper TaxID=425513 RepID=A0A4R6T2B3_9SPHI|nr:HAMP domain-containing sensor histidine kinase [Pedobacter metabolipauper]TDQ11838.1 two-component system sensor histidine kinase VicK [Pedobacter metabolipauper]